MRDALVIVCYSDIHDVVQQLHRRADIANDDDDDDQETTSTPTDLTILQGEGGVDWFEFTDASLSRLLDALEAATQRRRGPMIESLYFDPSTVFDAAHMIHPASFSRFSSIVGSCQTLTSLMWGKNTTGRWLPTPQFMEHAMTSLTGIVASARNLVEMICDRVVFGGTHDDLMAFGEALGGHSVLKKLFFRSCKLKEGCIYASNVILSAISAMPSLEELDLGCWACPSLSADGYNLAALSQVCSHNHLRSLELFSIARFRFDVNMPPSYNPLVGATEIPISQSTSLRDLTIRLNVHLIEQCEPVATILRQNQVLESMDITLCSDSDHNDESSFDSFNRVVEALGENSTLQRLSIRRLRNCDLQSCCQKMQTSLAKMLEEQNTSLQALKFRYCNIDPNAMDKIAFYIKLNKAGRKQLLQNPSAKLLWLDAMVAAQNDLDVLYYFLDKNPSILS